MYAQIRSKPIRITPDAVEPPPGSVVMAHGMAGTAYQRMHSDGLWHSPLGHIVDFQYFRDRYDVKLAGDYIILTGPSEKSSVVRTQNQ